ncbi:hypothetical protein SD72_05745 [Leucobacter komagatae]|uniref:Uncharacterized protein n=2 Tax=Leucobacter komagatae TaxID=55969 RepID=A0A0D0HZR9_9MICO|nr:hypothetical protein [Leucobacter komagatae]KIP53061.1 hypothetical protein SD72_05745 [Leucobacter komagatae]
MTTHRAARTDFTTGEGLRTLLTRIHNAGQEAWRTDRDVAALMDYTATKYAPLARKHGLDAWEAASAAFDVMRTPSVLRANDPWGVITRAVQITCIAEARANGMLCSTHQARRPHYSVFHDAERLSDRENPLTDYHPAFHHHDPDDRHTEHVSDVDGESVLAVSAVEDTISLFTALGWPASTVKASVEYICERLARAGNRATAFEALRRDKHARALLDLPAPSWHGLLRTMLGNPEPVYVGTSLGRGVLLRLLIGEPVPVLLRDDELVLTITASIPVRGGGRG